jgi:hypothetical protein
MSDTYQLPENGTTMTLATTREQALAAMLIFVRSRLLAYGDHHMAKTPPQVDKATENYTLVQLINQVLLVQDAPSGGVMPEVAEQQAAQAPAAPSEEQFAPPPGTHSDANVATANIADVMWHGTFQTDPAENPQVTPRLGDTADAVVVPMPGGPLAETSGNLT